MSWHIRIKTYQCLTHPLPTSSLFHVYQDRQWDSLFWVQSFLVILWLRIFFVFPWGWDHRGSGTGKVDHSEGADVEHWRREDGICQWSPWQSRAGRDTEWKLRTLRCVSWSPPLWNLSSQATGVAPALLSQVLVLASLQVYWVTFRVA